MNIKATFKTTKEDIKAVFGIETKLEPVDTDRFIEMGREEERAKIWDDIQMKGTRKIYTRAFSYWYADNWKPKYDIRATETNSMFYSFYRSDGKKIKLPELLEEAGIVFDTSKALRNWTQMFAYSDISHAGTIDCTGATQLTSAFMQAAHLEQLYLKIKEDGTTTWGSSFSSLPKLSDFKIISGRIGQSFNIQGAPSLTVDSIKNIIEHLMNYKGTQQEGVYTITFATDCWDRLEESGKAPDGNTWQEYINSSLGWKT